MKTNKEFLESMSTSDELIDHSIEECGLCCHQRIMADVARELLENNNSTIHDWAEITNKRWQDSKYYKLWQEETAAGRDPHEAFEKKGWEP